MNLCHDNSAQCVGGGVCPTDPNAFPACTCPKPGSQYSGSGCSTPVPVVTMAFSHPSTPGIVAINGKNFADTIDVYFGEYKQGYLVEQVVVVILEGVDICSATILAPPGLVGDGPVNVRIRSNGLVSNNNYFNIFPSKPMPSLFTI